MDVPFPARLLGSTMREAAEVDEMTMMNCSKYSRLKMSVIVGLAVLAGTLPADAQHRRAYSSYSSNSSANKYKPSYQSSGSSSTNYSGGSTQAAPAYQNPEPVQSLPSTNYYAPPNEHGAHSDPPIARPGDSQSQPPVPKKSGFGKALRFLDNQMNKLDSVGSRMNNYGGLPQQDNIYHPPGGFSKTGKLSPNFFSPPQRTGGYESDLQQRIMDQKGNN